MSAAKKAGMVTAGASTPTAPTTPRPSSGGGGMWPRPAPSAGAATQTVPPPRPVPSTAPSGTVSSRQAAAGRKVRLTIARVDPWSAMKLSFLLSVALGIAGVVMTAVMWTLLAGMGVFDKVNSVVGNLFSSSGTPFNILDFIGFGRVVSLAVLFGVIDVVLITAIATLAAFLYNVSANLVGGVRLTVTDD